jgi:hypothetical protein
MTNNSLLRVLVSGKPVERQSAPGAANGKGHSPCALHQVFIAVPLMAVMELALAAPPSPPSQVCTEDDCAEDVVAGGYEFPDIPTSPSTAPLRVVTTFNNAGLYWKEPTGSDANEALVRFRKVGTPNWRQGHSLWFDGRSAAQIPMGAEEYRGSVVGLDANSTYEIEVLSRGSGKLATARASTWKEELPVGSVVRLPERSTTTLNITQSGTPDGYVLYTYGDGRQATIDGENKIEAGVRISASYVIVKGLTIRNVSRYGIALGPNAHHVVIADNDIANFGRQDPVDGRWGCNQTGGIGTTEPENFQMKGLVIENNKIHHPNFDSNSWEEARTPSPGCGPEKDKWHPAGSTGIYLFNTGGNHVIRYNEIFSDLSHMFDDGIGGGQNFSTNGNLRQDSDVHGNRISYTWDDAIEVEGANQNVRIYDNYTERAMVAVAAAPVAIGPLYVFRNVATKGIRSPELMSGEGWFLKTRSRSVDGTVAGIEIGGGRTYLYHNTLFSTSTSDSIKTVFSCDDIGLLNIVSRNNIFDTRSAIGSRLVPSTHADLDFDMYPSAHTTWSAEERNGIPADPTYDAAAGSGAFALKESSAGHDAAAKLPNFNDVFQGGAPDVGAQERGRATLEFGTR